MNFGLCVEGCESLSVGSFRQSQCPDAAPQLLLAQQFRSCSKLQGQFTIFEGEYLENQLSETKGL